MLIDAAQDLFSYLSRTINCDALQQYMQSRKPTSDVSFAPNVWHYTTTPALLGIVNERNIWATNIFYMNDKKEYIHSLDWIKTNITTIYSGETRRRRLPLLDAIASYLPDIFYPHVYVTCFSESNDQLSQWRAYTGVDNGFSIGFDRVSLSGLADNLTSINTGSVFYFQKVLYRDYQKRAALKTLLDALWQFKNSNKLSIGNDNDMKQLALLALSMSSELAISMKAETFREEREWRLICFYRYTSDGKPIDQSIPTKFRVGAYGLTPYIELTLQSNNQTQSTPMSQLFVGPSRFIDENYAAATLLFEERGTKIFISKSSIALR